MAHIGLEIIHSGIYKHFRVRFDHIGHISFEIHLFGGNVKYKGKFHFPDFKIYKISHITLLGLTVASHIYIGPTPLCSSDAIAVTYRIDPEAVCKRSFVIADRDIAR